MCIRDRMSSLEQLEEREEWVLDQRSEELLKIQEAIHMVEEKVSLEKVCIQRRLGVSQQEERELVQRLSGVTVILLKEEVYKHIWVCLLYTSDAADERSSVDLGGRRIIKKKNNKQKNTTKKKKQKKKKKKTRLI